MWKISILITQKGGDKKVITSSYYNTEEEANAAAAQLRLLSYGWKKSCRDAECERENAPSLSWKHSQYIVTTPKQVNNIK